MSFLKNTSAVTLLASAALFAGLTTSTTASANGNNQNAPVTVYFTRHAEKKTSTLDLGDGLSQDVCGVSKCAEELNAEGLLRARLLADWFANRGITDQLTHAFSSNKKRTLQTIELIAADAGLDNDVDMTPDGVQQLPANGTELDPESTGASRDLTIEALLNMPGGSHVLVAGHSGTIYKIMDNIGLDTSDPVRFPRKSNGKVRDFGDIWKVVIHPAGSASLHWAVKLDAVRLQGAWR